MCRQFSTLILSAILLLATGMHGYAQEICNNAKDDDGDGLIDLADPDCACNFHVTGNLLQNGSFESASDCPNYYYDHDYKIADHWQYGTYTNFSEANYYHNLHCPDDSTMVMLYIPPLLPIPDGSAFISIRQYVTRQRPVVETGMAKTYIGQCLQSPLTPGEQYTLSFSAGRFKSHDDPNFKYKNEPFTVAVYGHPDCNAVPFGPAHAASNGCPENYAGWILLGKTKVFSQGRWVQNKIDFIVPAAINVIEIGPDCSILNPDFDLPDTTTFSDFYVYYLDDLHLLPTKDFHFVTISGRIGNTCDIDSVLTAPSFINGNYQWYKESIAIAGASGSKYYLPSANKTGNYNVRITNVDTCFISESFYVGIDNLSALTLPADTSFCKDEELMLAPALNGVMYTWNGASAPFVSVTTPGVYNILATDANGCSKAFHTKVAMDDCAHLHFYIPNAFTPNNDGNNDLFRIPRDTKINVKEFSVFDRWGNRVFSTANRGIGWDGRLQGEACAAGIYVYIIKGIINNRYKQITGTVMLLR